MTNASNTLPDNNTAMHSELQRARVRQRRQHVWIAAALMICSAFIVALITFSNGTLIKVQPQQAAATAQLNVSNTLGFAVAETAYALYGSPTIEVSAFGFKALHKTLLASETGGTLAITLSEQPQLLAISTIPESDQTRWLIDASPHSLATEFKRSEFKRSELKQELLSGQYQIGIDNPYYEKKNISITMQLGKALQQNIDLQPVAGHINIITKPAGATIFINDQAIGTSPLSLDKAGGQYRLEIRHADFQNIHETIEITNSTPLIERDYRLAPKNAYVRLHLTPAGGVLLLNGKKTALSNASSDISGNKPIGNKPIAIKAHENNILSYHKAGYFSQQRHIKLAPEAEQQVSFHLKAEIGKVDVRSQPIATILVDGKNMGKTPQLLKLSALTHRIELRRNGYRSFKTSITPSSKSTRRIRAALITESQARLHEAPQQFTNTVGIALKLFKPNNSSFVMGAPRYEKGQRANEFLRSIKLTRAFYISKYEISRAQFSRFKKTPGAQNEPITSISWIEAAQYCNWLSAREKLKPFYNIRHGQYRGFNNTSGGYRLPTEAEWEWLARKAGKNKQSKFSWGDATTIPANAGNIADEYAKGSTSHYVPNYSDAYAGIAPVGSYPAEKSGLYDVTGNVSEWVHDVYGLIPPNAQNIEQNPLGATSGNTHTVKGSNWRSGSITELRASYREGATQGRDDIGFRIARYL
ncbi:MAG: SUMF1/EgtB/PvdO family nonheme iron enzyme [Mariprofundus sp.]|nr:SUMF1/EgtB/PvdO family nonheme iron enzyme [Mariprofundus sp.]